MKRAIITLVLFLSGCGHYEPARKCTPEETEERKEWMKECAMTTRWVQNCKDVAEEIFLCDPRLKKK